MTKRDVIGGSENMAADGCVTCTTWCYLTPLGWYCPYHGFVDTYDPR